MSEHTGLFCCYLNIEIVDFIWLYWLRGILRVVTNVSVLFAPLILIAQLFIRRLFGGASIRYIVCGYMEVVCN